MSWHWFFLWVISRTDPFVVIESPAGKTIYLATDEEIVQHTGMREEPCVKADAELYTNHLSKSGVIMDAASSLLLVAGICGEVRCIETTTGTSEDWILDYSIRDASISSSGIVALLPEGHSEVRIRQIDAGPNQTTTIPLPDAKSLTRLSFFGETLFVLDEGEQCVWEVRPNFQEKHTLPDNLSLSKIDDFFVYRDIFYFSQGSALNYVVRDNDWVYTHPQSGVGVNAFFIASETGNIYVREEKQIVKSDSAVERLDLKIGRGFEANMQLLRIYTELSSMNALPLRQYAVEGTAFIDQLLGSKAFVRIKEDGSTETQQENMIAFLSQAQSLITSLNPNDVAHEVSFEDFANQICGKTLRFPALALDPYLKWEPQKLKSPLSTAVTEDITDEGLREQVTAELVANMNGEIFGNLPAHILGSDFEPVTDPDKQWSPGSLLDAQKEGITSTLSATLESEELSSIPKFLYGHPEHSLIPMKTPAELANGTIGYEWQSLKRERLLRESIPSELSEDGWVVTEAIRAEGLTVRLYNSRKEGIKVNPTKLGLPDSESVEIAEDGMSFTMYKPRYIGYKFAQAKAWASDGEFASSEPSEKRKLDALTQPFTTIGIHLPVELWRTRFYTQDPDTFMQMGAKQTNMASEAESMIEKHDDAHQAIHLSNRRWVNEEIKRQKKDILGNLDVKDFQFNIVVAEKSKDVDPNHHAFFEELGEQKVQDVWQTMAGGQVKPLASDAKKALSQTPKYTGQGSKDVEGTHGTHVGGLLAARPCRWVENGGFFPYSQLLLIDPSDLGELRDRLAKLPASIDPVINMSQTLIPKGTKGIRELKQIAKIMDRNRRYLFVVAAGNQAKDLGDSRHGIDQNDPRIKRMTNVLVVGALDNSGTHLEGTNYGASFTHLLAPGEDVMSLGPEGSYQIMSGTSMATPQVTAAALVLFKKYGSKFLYNWGTRARERLIYTGDQIRETRYAFGGVLNLDTAMEGDHHILKTRNDKYTVKLKSLSRWRELELTYESGIERRLNSAVTKEVGTTQRVSFEHVKRIKRQKFGGLYTIFFQEMDGSDYYLVRVEDADLSTNYKDGAISIESMERWNKEKACYETEKAKDFAIEDIIDYIARF